MLEHVLSQVNLITYHLMGNDMISWASVSTYWPRVETHSKFCKRMNPVGAMEALRVQGKSLLK